MEDLNYDIQDFIDTSLIPLQKEFKFFKESDWTKASSLKDRINEHALSALITEKAIQAAKDLHKIAKDSLGHKEVKKVMNLSKKVFDIYEQRYHKYTETQDWSTYMEEGKDISQMEAEMKFQIDIRNELNGFKRTLRGINFGEEDKRVAVATLNDAPLPLFMREMIVNKFPEVGELLKQIENKDVTTNTRKVKKKGNGLPKQQGQ